MNGIYGTIKPAYLTTNSIANDVDMYYSYRENRGVENSLFKSLNSSNLVPAKTEDTGEVIPGLFTLNLPLEDFGNPGIYTIYIKPKEIETTIIDIGVLSAYPDVRGIVLKNFSGDDSTLNVNGALTGYRVEYFGLAGNSRSEDFTIITSATKCSTIIQHIICTVAPSTSPSFNANSLPYIGRAGETIRLSNTKFEPLLIEVEMVEYDDETISIMLEGNQIRNLDNGLITTYDFNNEIYRQHEYFTIKETTGKDLYDVKRDRGNNIDTSQDFNEITNAAL